MKTLRFIGMAFIAIVLSMSLYSCSDDDDDEGGGGGSSNSPKSDVSVITTKDGEQLLLSSIKRGSSTHYSFSYDSEGKLTYVDDLYDWGAGEVSYNPFVIVYENNGTYITDKLTETLTFNSNGYMTKLVENHEYENSRSPSYITETYTGTCNISYDSSGHITKISYSENGQENYNGEKDSWTATLTANFTWSSGNLTKASISESESYGYKDNMNYTFTYGDTQNEYNQYLMATTFHDAEFEGLFSFGFIGYLGKGTAYLPSKVEYSGTEEDEGDKEDYSGSYTYSYTLNSNGTINTEKENNTTYTYSYVTLGSTRSVLETPIAETLSAQENSKFKGIFRSIHERHKKHHTQK